MRYEPPRERGIVAVEFWWLDNIRICNILLVRQLIQDRNVFNGLRLEYALEGNSNYIAWKDRMEVFLKDNGFKGYIDNDVPKLDAIDTANIDAWQKKVAKARSILLENV